MKAILFVSVSISHNIYGAQPEKVIHIIFYQLIGIKQVINPVVKSVTFDFSVK
jgi:hypothetical protein